MKKKKLKKHLVKLDPIEILAYYIEAREGTKGICDTVPINAINNALGSIEEILYSLDIEPYFKKDDDDYESVE